MLATRLTVLVIGCGLWLACASGASSVRREQLRGELRAALQRPVATRQARDDLSRLMAQTADENAFQGMNRGQLQAALGKGAACRSELCAKQGFGEGDWYYEIGIAMSDTIKQLPVLIIGFDERDRVARVWTLTTH